MRKDNPRTYYTPAREVKTLTVEFVTDMVPGAFHNPEDLMNWILQNRYVKSVSLD
jgi:hypothetical protein